MRTFTDLLNRSTAFTLAVRAVANEKASDALQAIAAIPLVKTVQMVRLQRVILVVGTLSIFGAALQRWPDCKNGFKQASETSEQKSKIAHKDMGAEPHELSTCSRMINVEDITNW